MTTIVATAAAPNESRICDPQCPVGPPIDALSLSPQYSARICFSSRSASHAVSDNAQIAFGVREGDLLAGKYRIDKILGAGGMGVVVAAHHLELDERVAIKFLLPATLHNQQAVARFAREARAAVKIKSEHVAKVTDVGKLENGSPYMVMEYLDGGDLASWLGQRGSLPIEEAVDFVLQACEAIAEAHVLGIVHRDLKPANLFVIRRPDGALSVKVLDFGISKIPSNAGSDASSAMTATSALMGSPLYMSPEQMQSPKDVDARSDIWALGVILYELLAGTAPFAAGSMPELVIAVVSSPSPTLRSKLPNAPEGLEMVIGRCLDKDRGRRFQTVGELAVALLPFAPKRSKLSVERISGVMRAAGLAGTAIALPPSSDSEREEKNGAGTAAPWTRTAIGTQRGRFALLVGIAGIAGVALSVASVKMRRAAPAEQSPSHAMSAEASAAAEARVAMSTAEEPVAQQPPQTVSSNVPSAPMPSDRNVPGATSEPARPSRQTKRTAPARTTGETAVVISTAGAVPPPAMSNTPSAPPSTTPAKTKTIFEDRK